MNSGHPVDQEFEVPLRWTASGWSPIAPGTDYEHTDFVEQPEWSWLVPSLHQLLAAPSAGRSLPIDRSPAADDKWAWLAYALAGSYFVGYLLGWTGPTLWSWIEAGRPDSGDARLRLLADVWGRWDYDVSIAAILHPGVIGEGLTPAMGQTGYCGYTGGGLRRAPDDVRQRCQRATDQWGDAVHHPHPGDDGGDGMHLADHLAAVMKTSVEPDSVDARITDEDAGLATLCLDQSHGWYPTMDHTLRTLPERTSSWRLEVWTKPIGYMGTWRISRSTGLPFQGRHRIHQWAP